MSAISGYTPSDVLVDLLKGGFSDEDANAAADYVRNVRLDAEYSLYKSLHYQVRKGEEPVSKEDFKRARDDEKILELLNVEKNA